jgi:hypothetical protein
VLFVIICANPYSLGGDDVVTLLLSVFCFLREGAWLRFSF